MSTLKSQVKSVEKSIMKKRIIGIYAAGKFTDEQKPWKVYTESVAATLRQITATIIYYTLRPIYI